MKIRNLPIGQESPPSRRRERPPGRRGRKVPVWLWPGRFPFSETGRLACLLYGGVLLNRDVTIVDTIRDTVFHNETYKGRNIGTATIFFEDLRISTNVLTPEGKRAIGTRISAEVKTAVLDEGRKWTDRAFVVNDWYLTAYEPIEDIRGKRVGILYVGVLEEKYGDIRRNAFTIFIALTILGMALSVGLGLFLGVPDPAAGVPVD